MLSKEEVPCAVGLPPSMGTSLPPLSPTQGCHPALTIPGGAEHLLHIESRWGWVGGGEGFLSLASYLPRSMANGPGCALGWPASPTIPFLSDTSRQASNEKPETGLQNKHGQINATRNLSGPSEGNEACDMKISSENCNPPK